MMPIQEFIDFVKKYYDAPQFFVESTAYAIQSALYADKVVILGAPKFQLHPNLYDLLSGPPAVSRKSQLLELATRIYSAVRDQHSIMGTGTRAGLIDEIAELNEKEGMWSFFGIYDEFGVTLSMMQGLEYMLGALGTYSKLYYGEPDYELFSKRNKENKSSRILPRGVVFTILGGLQKPKEFGYINRKTIEQGSYRRFKIDVLQQDDIPLSRWREPIDYSRSDTSTGNDWETQIEILIQKYKAKYDEINQIATDVFNGTRGITPLREKYKFPFIFAIMEPSVTVEINDMAKQHHQQSFDSFYKPGGSTVETEWEKLAKLAVLRAIDDPLITTTLPTAIIVTQQHLDYVKPHFQMYLERYLNLQKEILTAAKQVPTYSETDIVETIMEEINKAVTSGISATDLQRNLNSMPKTDLIKHLPSLFESEKIFAALIKDVGKKAKRIFFTSKADADTYVANAAITGAKSMIYCSEDYKFFLNEWT
jgi:hypothetical protein